LLLEVWPQSHLPLGIPLDTHHHLAAVYPNIIEPRVSPPLIEQCLLDEDEVCAQLEATLHYGHKNLTILVAVEL
jgi:hypothetical protein